MSRCGRTIKLTNFKPGGAVFDGSRFVLADDSTVTGAQVKAFVRSIAKQQGIVNTVGGTFYSQGLEDYILCTGNVTVYLIEAGATSRPVNISARGGTVTVVPEGTDTIQTGTITDGNSLLLVADNSGYWRAV